MSTAFPPSSPHPGDEELELYALNRVPSEDQLARIEEHLLICEHCRLELEETEVYLRALRSDLQDRRREPQRPFRFVDLLRPLTAPSPAIRFALAAVFVAIVLFSGQRYWNSRAGAVQSVELSALRSAPGAVQAESGKALTLSLDLLGLPDRAAYECEIVDEFGGAEWKGTARRVAGRAVAETGTRLSAGQYWVRLREGGNLLREYGLRVR